MNNSHPIIPAIIAGAVAGLVTAAITCAVWPKPTITPDQVEEAVTALFSPISAEDRRFADEQFQQRLRDSIPTPKKFDLNRSR